MGVYLSIRISPNLTHDQVVGEGGQLLHAHNGHLLLLALLLPLSRQLIVHLRTGYKCK